MSLDQIRLGFAPGAGKAAMDQCSAFKRAIWAKLGRNHDGAYLITIRDPEAAKEGIAVVYDRNTAGGEEWARRAQDAAAEVWKQVSDRKERCR